MDYIDMYLPMSGLDESSKKQYSSVLRSFANVIGKPLDSVNTNDILRYMNYMRSEMGSKESTVGYRVRVIRAFYNFLYEGRYINDNPARGLHFKYVAKSSIRDSLKGDEVELMLDAAMSPREYLSVRLLAETGMKLRELSSFSAGDFNAKLRSVHVQSGGVEAYYKLSRETAMLLQCYSGQFSRDIILFPYVHVPRDLKQVAVRAGLSKNITSGMFRGLKDDELGKV